MSDELYNPYNFRPFVDKYKGRLAIFEYQGSGLVHVTLVDGEDHTFVDDDQIYDILGSVAYGAVRRAETVTLPLLEKSEP